MENRGSVLERLVVQLLREHSGVAEDALAGCLDHAGARSTSGVDIGLEFAIEVTRVVGDPERGARIHEDLEHVDLASVGVASRVEVHRALEQPTWVWMGRWAPIATTLVLWLVRRGVVREEANLVLHRLYQGLVVALPKRGPQADAFEAYPAS